MYKAKIFLIKKKIGNLAGENQKIKNWVNQSDKSFNTNFVLKFLGNFIKFTNYSK